MTEITNEELKQFVEDAEKATPLMWVIDNENLDGFGVVQKDDYLEIVPYGLSKGDAVHISNSCPPNFGAICKELLGLRFKHGHKTMAEYAEIEAAE